MSSVEKQQTETIAARSYSVKMACGPSISQTVQTDSTFVGEFSNMEHLLSSKPLRRPNRTRPLGDTG